jgi:hypothetical protein
LLNEQDSVTSPPAAPVLPESLPTDPVITMTDVEVAEDEDPEIYKKALEYWKASPNKDIAKNPPRYFAGKKPDGKKIIPGEGQKEMVRRYLVDMEKAKRAKAEKSTEESYLKIQRSSSNKSRFGKTKRKPKSRIFPEGKQDRPLHRTDGSNSRRKEGTI